MRTFLSSRFTPFRAARSRIVELVAQTPGLEARCINLDGGPAFPRPPLRECLEMAAAVDLFVLLLDEDYGEPAPGHAESYTHLEYLSAREADVPVFAFYRGDPLAQGTAVHDRRLSDFLLELSSAHTIKHVPRAVNDRELAQEVVRSLLNHRVMETMELSDRPPDPSTTAWLGAFPDDVISSTDEIIGLAELTYDPSDTRQQRQQLQGPASLVCREQCEMARMALEIQDYRGAIAHFRSAVAAVDVDMIATYWLAKLYSYSTHKGRLSDAVHLAERAADLARNGFPRIYRADAFLTAARAVRRGGEPRDPRSGPRENSRAGLAYAERAIAEVEHFGRAHLELARQYVHLGEHEPAVRAIRRAVQLHPRTIREAAVDADLKVLRNAIQSIAEDARAAFQRDVALVVANTRKLEEIAGLPDRSADVAGDYASVRERCRQMCERQRHVVLELRARHEEVERKVDMAEADTWTTYRLATQSTEQFPRHEDWIVDIRRREAEAKSRFHRAVLCLAALTFPLGFGITIAGDGETVAGAGIVLGVFVVAGLSARRARQHSEGARMMAGFADRLEQNEASLQRSRIAAREALDLFRDTLGVQLSLLPYASPFRREIAGLVRCKRREIDDLATKYDEVSISTLEWGRGPDPSVLPRAGLYRLSRRGEAIELVESYAT